MQLATRLHDFSAGHRVVGHENKCRLLHGHNYRVTFHCTADDLDSVGRVLDFASIKDRLCQWLEDNWDHRMLIWKDDPLLRMLQIVSNDSVVVLPFNPTAENMAQYLVSDVGPCQLAGTGVILTGCEVEETRKCSASFWKEPSADD